MIPVHDLLVFAGASLLLVLTPGPNMAYLAVLSAERGRLAGFAAVLGVALGLATLGLYWAVGIRVRHVTLGVGRTPYLSANRRLWLILFGSVTISWRKYVSTGKTPCPAWWLDSLS